MGKKKKQTNKKTTKTEMISRTNCLSRLLCGGLTILRHHRSILKSRLFVFLLHFISVVEALFRGDFLAKNMFVRGFLGWEWHGFLPKT